MKITQQRKRKLAKKHSQLKASWNKVFTITQSYEEGWGERLGVTIDYECFDFLTNFTLRELSIYIEAIRTYKGPAKFGICNKAWGFYEDEGVSFSLGSGYFGLYTQGETSLDNFWKHFDKIKDRANHLRAKVRELTSRKAVYHKWYGHTEADGIALAQKLTSELPDKWKKYFKYTIVQRADQTFDICFGPINAASPRPHAMKNLVKAYAEINYKARYFEINIIGKF